MPPMCANTRAHTHRATPDAQRQRTARGQASDPERGTRERTGARAAAESTLGMGKAIYS